MSDHKPDFCDTTFVTNDMHNFTKIDDTNKKPEESYTLYKRFLKWLLQLYVKYRDQIFHTTSEENEKKFLNTQRYLRNEERSEFEEAEYILKLLIIKHNRFLLIFRYQLLR
jgi:hypothetical protein